MAVHIKSKSKVAKRQANKINRPTEQLPKYSLGGDMLSGAAAGAAAGAVIAPPWGSIGLGLAGLVTSGVKHGQANRAEEAADQQNLEDNARQYRTSTYEGNPNYTPINDYALGGGVNMPNAELEGGESFQPNVGAPMAIPEGAPSHSEGGVKLNLPPGKVFSDTLKVGGTKKTFADVHKKLEKNKDKYQGVIDDPQTTRTAKRTAEKNLNNTTKEIDALYEEQQSLNGDFQGGGQPMSPQGGQPGGPQQGQMMPPNSMPGQMIPPQGDMGLNQPQMAPQGPSPEEGIPAFQDGGGVYGRNNPFDLQYMGDNSRRVMPYSEYADAWGKQDVTGLDNDRLRKAYNSTGMYNHLPNRNYRAPANGGQNTKSGLPTDFNLYENNLGNMLPEVTSKMYSPAPMQKFMSATEGADFVNSTYNNSSANTNTGNEPAAYKPPSIPYDAMPSYMGSIRNPSGFANVEMPAADVNGDLVPNGAVPPHMRSMLTSDGNYGTGNPNGFDPNIPNEDSPAGVAGVAGTAGTGVPTKEAFDGKEFFDTFGAGQLHTNDPLMRGVNAAGVAMGGVPLTEELIGQAAGPDATPTLENVAGPDLNAVKEKFGKGYTNRQLNGGGFSFGGDGTPGSLGGVAGGIISAAPSIMNMVQGLTKPKKTKRHYNIAGQIAAAKIRDYEYDIDPAKDDAKMNFEANRRNLATRSRGEQIAGTTALQGNLSRTLSQLYATKANAESQKRTEGYALGSQVGAFNANVATAADERDRANEAAAVNFRGAGATGFSNIYQQRIRDNQAREMDKLKLAIMGTTYGGLDNTAYGDLLARINADLAKTKN